MQVCTWYEIFTFNHIFELIESLLCMVQLTMLKSSKIISQFLFFYVLTHSYQYAYAFVFFLFFMAQ